MIQLIGKVEQKDFKLKSHKFYVVNDAPQQLNEFDCSVFTFDYVQYKHTRDISIFDYHSNFKRFIMNELLRSDLSDAHQPREHQPEDQPEKTLIDIDDFKILKTKRKSLRSDYLSFANF